MHSAAAPLRETLPLSWVTEDRLHLTLRFLGERSPEEVARLGDALAERAAPHAPLLLNIGGVGAFPSFRRPRVIWMGIAADPKLELLRHDVELACGALGVEPEGRAFRPHVTLGRVRERLDREQARALQRSARSVRFTADVPVGTVDVMCSELLPEGARHTPLRAIALGSA